MLSMCRFATIVVVLLIALPLHAANFPDPVPGDFIIRDFKFTSGESLPDVRIHYRTLGKPVRDDKGIVKNAVLVLHGTGGEGGRFVGKDAIGQMFAGELFGKGQPLDATRYYIIIPDNLGHGLSTKPSDKLRARFPKYGYHDMITAQHRLLTEGLKVNHLRLVMGTSMGGMHTWLWGQKFPDFMDALMPLASLPTQISGRNRAWRKMMSESIRTDPEWLAGEYKTQPRGLRFAVEMMFMVSSNPVLRQNEGPTGPEADKMLEQYVATALKRTDANDLLYAVECSFDYDPGPGLGKIKAPLLAINFADDLINPPELGILEKEIGRVPKGRAVLMPLTAETVGHGTHTKAAVWKQHLEKLLKDSER
jgi:homoserine O-acetyltransferase/O-succinyltransferase